jgi:ABC-2 type transport system permease protein
VSEPISSNGRGDARIVARGFARYEGPRSGVPGAIRSVAWQSIRATLGIGRLARHKVFPIISVAIAYVPAIVFVGISVLLPEEIANQVVDYPGYYGFITAAIVLFGALVAPEVLVGDRRNGMLALYLSTPLHRGTYLASKAIAALSMLLLVTLGPPLLVLLGYTFADVGPDGVAGWFGVLLRILGSGLAVAIVLGSVSMGVSCLTNRRAFAATAMVLLVLATPALGGALVDGAGLSPYWRVIDVFSMPFELVFRIYGQSGNFPEIATWAVAAVCFAWTAAGLGTVAWRYRSLVIAR